VCVCVREKERERERERVHTPPSVLMSSMAEAVQPLLIGINGRLRPFIKSDLR
jgi:hypothetical protein